MRLALALLAVLLLAGCIAVDSTREVVTAPPAPTPPIINAPDAAGKVTVLESAAGEDGATLLTVGYENTTALTLALVTLRCRGFDEAGYQIAVSDETIMGVHEGPIGPGFKTRKQLWLDGKGIASTSCGVARAEAEPASR
jgi:hypothetical protein